MTKPLLFLVSAALALSSARAADARAAETPPSLSAQELAAAMNARGEGMTYVRLRLETKQAASETTLQLQLKERRTRKSAEVLAQVLWPKARKGEGVLLRSGAGAAPGAVFTAEGLHPLTAEQMKEPFFGSDLSYADLVENFFAWESQALVGAEAVEHVTCQILESKPGGHSVYGKVRSWIDPKRLVPLRVEKYYPSGQLARRILTTRVAGDDQGHSVPADLTVEAAKEGSVTTLAGSKISHEVSYTEADFTTESLKALTGARGAPAESH